MFSMALLEGTAIYVTMSHGVFFPNLSKDCDCQNIEKEERTHCHAAVVGQLQQHIWKFLAETIHSQSAKRMSLERVQKETHLDEVVEFAHVLVACKHGAQVLIALGASPCGEKGQWQHSLEHYDAGFVWYVRVVGRRYVRRMCVGCAWMCVRYVGIGDASIRHGEATEGALDRKEQNLN